MKIYLWVLLAAHVALGNPLQQKLLQVLQQKSDPQIRLYIENFNIPKDVTEDAVIEILGNKTLGPVSFKLRWGKFQKLAMGTALVKGFAHIAVAKSIIPHGQKVSLENVLMEERELSALISQGFLTELKEDLSAKGLIRPGQVLSMFNTMQAPAVVRDQMVDLVFESKDLKITARVRALDNGSPGSWIHVENPSSKKKFLAKVISTQEVRMQ